MMDAPFAPGLNLLIDADDTLWENNIYFEQAFDDFCVYLSHSSMTPVEIRAVLDEIGLANSRLHGYGSRNFGRNLRECYHRLSESHVREEDLNAVMAFAERILDCPMEVIAGVETTLEYLASRHQLTLFTKGHPEEQKLKIDRSGLAAHFVDTAIVKEKDADAYRCIVKQRGFDASQTWMIGNSPKSDVNPALAVGLNAVFIPHARTWTLERQEIIPGTGKLVVVNRFEDLKQLF